MHCIISWRPSQCQVGLSSPENTRMTCVMCICASAGTLTPVLGSLWGQAHPATWKHIPRLRLQKGDGLLPGVLPVCPSPHRPLLPHSVPPWSFALLNQKGRCRIVRRELVLMSEAAFPHESARASDMERFHANRKHPSMRHYYVRGKC